MTIDTACSSSLVAAHLAIRALQSSECDLAVVGGANLILDPVMDNALRAGVHVVCIGRCYKDDDVEADGYVRGEGVGVVILRRMADAIESDLIHASVVSGVQLTRMVPAMD